MERKKHLINDKPYMCYNNDSKIRDNIDGTWTY